MVDADIGLAFDDLVCSPVEDAKLRVRADAALFHFTHDILLRPEAIANVLGHLKPGARLHVSDLAHALQMSQTPVREALSMLEKEHLIERKPQKGFRVSALSLQGVEDLYDLRIALEVLAARQAAQEAMRKQKGNQGIYCGAAIDLADGRQPVTGSSRSARDGRLKLIAAPTEELYDLAPDPGELRNLAAERPAEVRRLTAAVEAWSAAGGAADSTLSVDAETAGMLRALGYAAGDTARPAGEGRGNPVELMPVHDELQAVGSLLANGRPEEAVRRARGALALDPDNLTGLRDLSRGLVQLGRLDEAATAADRAAAIAPWSAEAFTVAADIAHRRGAAARALELVDRALALDPRFLEARVERSRYLAALGRSGEAAAELADLLEQAPDDNWVALRYAELVELPAGDLAAAERRLRQVLARNPSFAEAWLLLGTVLTRAGRGSEAAEVYRQAAAEGVIDPDSQARAALLLAAAGDPAAEAALRAAISAAELEQAI